MEKSVAEGEFCELGKCVFECVKEGLHAVHAAQSQLQHELESVLRADAPEGLERSICLPCREYAAHDVSDMVMHWSVCRPRKQLGQQLFKREMFASVHPVLGSCER